MLMRGILFVVAQTLIITSGFVMYVMIGEVNRKLPEERQIPFFIGHRGKYQPSFSKYWVTFTEYRKHYPKGRLQYFFWLTFLGGMCTLAALAWKLRLF